MILQVLPTQCILSQISLSHLGVVTYLEYPVSSQSISSTSVTSTYQSQATPMEQGKNPLSLLSVSKAPVSEVDKGIQQYKHPPSEYTKTRRRMRKSITHAPVSKCRGSQKAPIEKRQHRGEHGSTVNTTPPQVYIGTTSSSIDKRPKRACTKKRKYTEIAPDDDGGSEYHPSDNDENKQSRYADASERKRCKVKATKTNKDGQKKRPFHPSLCPAYHLGCTLLLKRDSDSLRHFQSSCKFNFEPVAGAKPVVKVGEEGWQKISLDGKFFYLPILTVEQYREYVLERIEPRCICGKEFKRKDAVKRHQARCGKARALGITRRTKKCRSRGSV